MGLLWNKEHILGLSNGKCTVPSKESENDHYFGRIVLFYCFFWGLGKTLDFLAIPICSMYDYVCYIYLHLRAISRAALHRYSIDSSIHLELMSNYCFFWKGLLGLFLASHICVFFPKIGVPWIIQVMDENIHEPPIWNLNIH